MSASLVVAVPSKGRLQENTLEAFTKAGLELVRSGAARHYRGRIAGVAGAEVAYLSAPEIAREIGAGAVHLGVTGRDQVEETVPDWQARAAFVAPLGFGQCEVVVAVPEAWIDVDTMADLDDVAADFRPRHGRRLTVATKYITLTRRFFAGHGIADYRIVESLGATEGAPASGAADLIVDITTTGTTLKANGLKNSLRRRNPEVGSASGGQPSGAVGRRGAPDICRPHRAIWPEGPRCGQLGQEAALIWPCSGKGHAQSAVLRCSKPPASSFYSAYLPGRDWKENTDEHVHPHRRPLRRGLYCRPHQVRAEPPERPPTGRHWPQPRKHLIARARTGAEALSQPAPEGEYR